MLNEMSGQSKTKNITTVNVAVAVIYYKTKYLLGFRDAAQHQGNRYEFVGGKIEADESAEQALIREVAEETGIDIHQNMMVKLGRLHHDYGDKQVSLQVYQVELTAQQYEQHKHCEYGLEGQAMTWVEKSKLLVGAYDLPAANSTILEWLKLPENIAITYSLAHFDTASSSPQAWLHYHQDNLPPAAWVYIRLKETEATHIAEQLLAERSDIFAILPYSHSFEGFHGFHSFDSSEVTQSAAAPETKTNHHIVARHVTHSMLMEWANDDQNAKPPRFTGSDYPLMVSCHDVASIHAANKLASLRIKQQLPPVIGVFLSPVLATQTHPDTAPLGWEAWSDLGQLADMPVIGLGGLAPSMIDQALAHGGISVAGIRHFH